MSSKTMFNAPGKKAGFAADRAHDGARGAALLITLILLALLSAASVAMVLLVSSDTMITVLTASIAGHFMRQTQGSTWLCSRSRTALKGTRTTPRIHRSH